MFCTECGEVIAPGRVDGRDTASQPFSSALGQCVHLLIGRLNKLVRAPKEDREDGFEAR